MQVGTATLEMANSVADVFLSHAMADPDAPFFIQGDHHVSRYSFLRQAAGLRAFFLEQGIAPGMVVGLANTDQLRSFAAMFALWSLRAAPLVLDYRISKAERSHVAKTAGVSVIFSDFKGLAAQDGCTQLPRELAPSGDISTLRFPNDPDAIVDFRQSSGTTALPKLKPISQQTLFDMTEQRCRPSSYVTQGNIVSCMNLAFAGTRYLWFRNAFLGRAIIGVPLFFTPAQLDAALRHPLAEEATLAPVILKRLVDYVGSLDARPAGPRYPGLAKLQSIGGPLTGQVLLDVQRLLSDRISTTYSFSEAGVVSRLYGNDIARHPTSAGRVLTGVSVVTVDDHGTEQPANIPGALVVTKAGETFRPGDHGYVSDEGLLYITGRDTERFCRNSVTFTALDVAERIRGMEAVSDCCVFAVPSDMEGEDIVVAAIEGDPARQSDIATRLRSQMLAEIRPDYIRLYPSLPRGSAMKIAIQSLKQHYLQEPERYHDL
ncbi:AMP-binding protein [Aliiroseovarius marinus]|uniref:AMP-binding protein n=1 Tax=Aliiroseovarius marinus TaxID=2500159 RepID=UPI0024943F3E|nr:class I adenylate-forming enzyme family protein [Aliiroseovarius marinus]